MAWFSELTSKKKIGIIEWARRSNRKISDSNLCGRVDMKKTTKIAILNKFSTTIQHLNSTCLFKIISKRSHDCKEELNIFVLLWLLEFFSKFLVSTAADLERVTLSFIFFSRLLRKLFFTSSSSSIANSIFDE
jgi:hypothetical protein